MNFRHSTAIWHDFPALAAGVILLRGITADADVGGAVERHTATARSRLAAGAEGGMPEIQAWRRAFAAMGLKPTQYRCAAESLLRRLRRDGTLPRIHPLVDLCNAVSVAFAVPVAALDADRIDGDLEVRYATGDETYLSLAGVPEPPERGEVIFADAGGHAHARRWTHRQSGRSAVGAATTTALIVAEGLHASAAADVAGLIRTLSDDLGAAWAGPVESTMVRADSPRFTA